MPRTTNNASKAEKNKRSNQPIALFILEDYDGNGNDLRFARWDTNITFDGETYNKFPITFQSIEENTQNALKHIRITICNVSRLIQSYLEDYDLWDKKVVVRIVWANQLADADAKIDFTFYIDSYSANEEDVEFVCATKADIIDRQLPAECYLPMCRYKEFKGDQCGYAGAETECNRTPQRCKELDNYARFGGFPSIPGNRMFTA